jgi:hypothetical protein
MPYGYRPDDWPAFQSELERRGIPAAEIEKIELRPVSESPANTDITVTTRSGRVETWRQPPRPAQSDC